MEAITVTRRIGGSLVVTIPRKIVELQHLQENQPVLIDIQKKKISGFGISHGLASFSASDKFGGQLEKHG